MALQASKGAPAYRVPKAIRKQSWAKKRKKKVRGIPKSIKEIYKK